MRPGLLNIGVTPGWRPDPSGVRLTRLSVGGTVVSDAANVVTLVNTAAPGSVIDVYAYGDYASAVLLAVFRVLGPAAEIGYRDAWHATGEWTSAPGWARGHGDGLAGGDGLARWAAARLAASDDEAFKPFCQDARDKITTWNGVRF